jgi:concanavalin A-like lectin/glucanase superfamily protein/Big-like domain-containing protein
MVTSRHCLTLARVLCAVAVVAPLVTCSEHAPTQAGNDAAVEFQIVVSSPALPSTAPVGSTLPPLQVKVLNKKNGQTLYNEPVSFVVTAGGGTVFAPTVATDNASGIALDLWTLGTRVGFDTLQARVVDTSRVGPLAGSTSIVTFAIQATPLAAAVIGAQVGNGQTAVAGATLPLSPAVLVTDRFGNPIGGVNVTFALGSGGGSVTGTPQTTNANGIATVGSWTLGTTAGPNTLTATATGLTGSPVTFAATGINASAVQLIPATSTAFTGTTVAGTIPAATGPAVRVVDGNNNGVPNVAVTFTVTGPSCPSCSLYTGTSPSAPGKIASVGSITVLTDANGRASGGDWTLSTLAGANTLQATAVGLTGSPVVFTATGTAGAAALLFERAGDGQTASIGTALPIQPAVQVTDVYGNPSPSGIPVTFTVQSGGGGVSSAPSVTVTTDLSGTASVSWTLGSQAGANTLTATSVSHTVTFSATGTGPGGLNITNYRGDAQTQPAGTTLPIAPAVQLTDLGGHPVTGVQVVFNVTAGGGSIAGASQVTDVNGIATVGSWTLDPTPGVNELKASFNTGVSRGSTIFVATGLPCTPAPSGLVSWWPGEGNASDIVGSNRGTLLGGVTFGTGEVGQAFVTNGIDGYLDAGNAPSLHVSSGDFTAEAWVRFNAPQGDMSIVDKMSAGDADGWRLFKSDHDGGDNHFMFCLGGGNNIGDLCRNPLFGASYAMYTLRSTTSAVTGVWYHVAAVVAAVNGTTRFSLYVNGVVEDTRDRDPFFQPFLDTQAADLRIGSNISGAYLNGDVDEVSIYNRALSAQDIQAIYAAGAGGKCRP